MQPPRFKAFSREDFRGAPQWFEPLFTMFNETLGGVVRGLTQGLTRKENMLSGVPDAVEFTTSAVVAETWPRRFKNALSVKPAHCWVTKFGRVDGAALSAPYSMTWKLNQSNEIEVTMQGLDASTSYRLSIVYE